MKWFVMYLIIATASTTVLLLLITQAKEADRVRQLVEMFEMNMSQHVEEVNGRALTRHEMRIVHQCAVTAAADVLAVKFWQEEAPDL